MQENPAKNYTYIVRGRSTTTKWGKLRRFFLSDDQFSEKLSAKTCKNTEPKSFSRTNPLIMMLRKQFEHTTIRHSQE